MSKWLTMGVIAFAVLAPVAQAGRDITAPGDVVQGVPNDNDWPGNEPPRQAIDDQITTKYLHFKGGTTATGIRVTPAAGATVVTEVTFTTANDADHRDPVTYELSGSNESIDGPYTLIASGDIKDFAGATAWVRRTKSTTPMRFANTVAYKHYQLLFPKIRNAATEPYMQIAEIELLMDVFKATAPSPANGAVMLMPLFQWTKGDTAVAHNVYLGTSPDLTEADLKALKTSNPLYYHAVPPLEPGTMYYWRVDEVDAAGNIYTGDVWSTLAAPKKAYDPMPRDGNKWVSVNTPLSWSAGVGASSHTVYFGTDEAAVEARDAGVAQGSVQVPLYEPGVLQEQTTYYWAVDEKISGVTYAGPVWSFTTEGGGGGARGNYFIGTTPSGTPALSRIDPEINVSLTGTTSPGDPIPGDGWSARWTADLEIAVADMYTFSLNCQDGTRMWIDGKLIIDQWVTPTVTSEYFAVPMHLDAGIHSLRVEYFDNSGDAIEQLYWSTPTMAKEIIPAGPLQPPLRATASYPSDGAQNVAQSVALAWGVGEMAAKHHVYFGVDADAVANATTATADVYQGELAAAMTTFNVGDLEWNTTYYWRIDEVNDASADSPWKSSVWSFTTADYLVVDDFESYTDDIDAEETIWHTWIDGLTNGTGSQVGYDDSPFAEKTITHDASRQSLPFYFDNDGTFREGEPEWERTGVPFYSEIEREFSPAQDWTVNGVSDLTIWVKGYPAPLIETAPGQYTISANTADIWGTSDNFRFVYKTLNGDGAISAKVISVTGGSSTFAKPGVMIRDNLDPASSYALMHPTPDGKRSFQNRPSAGASAISAHSAAGAITFPVWVKVERKGNQFTAYYSQNGTTWIQQPDTENTGTDMSPNPQTIAMGNSVYIGLAVSSNNGAGGFCFAEFSDVVATGSVTGDWKVVNVGVNPGNDPAPLYVTVADSTGKSATVTNPDPAAVNSLIFTPWKTPLTSFTGVNMSKVKKIFIGVGDPTNPKPDGSGRIFIDDIGVTKP